MLLRSARSIETNIGRSIPPDALLVSVLSLVEVRGFEPLAYRLRTYRSSQLSYTPVATLIT